MLGTPEAFPLKREALEERERRRLLAIGGAALVATCAAAWALSAGAEALRQLELHGLLGTAVAGVEAFLVVVFAVTAQKLFMQLLGVPGSIGAELQRRSRPLWAATSVATTFVFLHTLINPRGAMGKALESTNMRFFLGTIGVFALGSVALWLGFRIPRTRRPTPVPVPVEVPVVAPTPEPDEEFRRLRLAPLSVYRAVAEADGAVEERETAAFGAAVSQFARAARRPRITAEVWASIAREPGAAFEDWRQDERAPHAALRDALAVLERRASPDETVAFRTELAQLGREVAEASGGVDTAEAFVLGTIAFQLRRAEPATLRTDAAGAFPR
jgi:hypothetical protein